MLQFSTILATAARCVSLRDPVAGKLSWTRTAPSLSKPVLLTVVLLALCQLYYSMQALDNDIRCTTACVLCL
jgi:hypothetical protein